MSFKKIFSWFLAWRVSLFIITFISLALIPTKFNFFSSESNSTNFFSVWANFDGIHYLDLAEFGYRQAFAHRLQAFFPLYPILIGYLNDIIGNYLASGLIISNLSFLLAIYFLYKLIKIDYPQKISTLSIILILIAPSSFFFGSVYSESLFLLLSVLSFYFARRQQWFFSTIFASIASATRFIGIFLLPAILIEFYLANKKNLKKTLTNPNLLLFLLAPIGLIIYILFLDKNFQQPFYFLTTQPFYGAQHELGRIILPHQVIFRYLKMLIFMDHSSILFFTILIEFITGILFIALSIFSFKKTRLSYAIYALLALITPTITGTFSSFPRYMVVLFPLIIVLSDVLTHISPKIKKIVLVLSSLGLILSTALFVSGYFIS